MLFKFNRAETAQRKKEKNLRSFYFAALYASCANVFFRSGSVRVFDIDLLKIRFVRSGSFTVGVADRVARQFAFTANAAYFTHILILRRNFLTQDTLSYYSIKSNGF